MGLLVLKLAGLVVTSAVLTYVHAWMPRTARIALLIATGLFLLLDDPLSA